MGKPQVRGGPGRDAGWAGLSLASEFLSRIFLLEPKDRFLETLRDMRLLREWPVSSPRSETVQGLEKMSGFLDTLSSEGLGELQRDFTRLFIGPGKAAAPPYESFYLGREGLLFDDVTLKIRSVYREYSLRAPRKNREPDDHIGLELSLAAELARRLSMPDLQRSCDMDETVEGLSNFLSGHLMRWSDDFIDRVLGAARTDFYRGAARVTRGTLIELASAAGL